MVTIFFATIKESYEVIQETCEKIIKEFDEEKLITSLSVAGYFGSITRFETAENFGTYMGSIKKRVKQIEGSAVIIVDS